MIRYGLHTLLELHFVQEEESYFALATESPTAPARPERCRRLADIRPSRPARRGEGP